MAEKKLKTLPLLRMVEWLGKNEVRLFFAHSKRIRVVEMFLPGVRSAKHVRVVRRGKGLALGDGREIGSWVLWELSSTFVAAVPGTMIKAGSKRARGFSGVVIFPEKRPS